MRAVPFVPGQATAMDEYPYDRRLQVIQSPDADPALQEAAVTSIIQQYSPSMHRIARHKSLTKEGAEDIVQESAIKIWRGLETFTPRGTEHLKNWVTRITYMAAFDKFRSETSYQKHLATGSSNEYRLQNLAAPEPTQQEVVEAKESFDEFADVMRRRTETSCRIVFLYALGFSFGEIAEKLEMPSAQTAKLKFFYERRQAAKLLAKSSN